MDHSTELRQYLVESSGYFNYKFRENARRDLRRALFQAASVNGKYIKCFFPDLEDEESVKRMVAPYDGDDDPGLEPPDMSMDIDQSDEDDIDDDEDEDEVIYSDSELASMGPRPIRAEPAGASTSAENRKNSNVQNWVIHGSNKDPSKEDPSHPGRPCVRKFKRGEPTYRCLSCGLDETCVMCHYCYDEAQHEGHQVVISISQQDCGGVCDCGDPEAWVKQFPCKYHMLENYSNDPLPEDLHDAIVQTVETALDFTIDVFSQSHTVVQRFKTPHEVETNEARATLSEDMYGIPDTATNSKYVLSLWNDQKHSFYDAINTIMHGTKKNRAFAEMVTKQIDGNGRGIVDMSDDLESLMKKKKAMESSGLVNTVRSCKDTYREEMCGVIFDWLSDISKSPVNNNYLVLRDIISQVLCEPWNYGLKCLREGKNQMPSSPEFEHAREMDTHGALDGPYIPDPTKFLQKDPNRMNMDDDGMELSDEDDEDEEYEFEEEAAQAVAGGAGDGDGDGAAAAVVAAAQAAAAATTATGNEDEEDDGAAGNDDNNNTNNDTAARLLAMITETQGIGLGQFMANPFANPFRRPQAKRKIKRPQLVQNRPPAEFWTNESNASKGKRQRVGARVQYLIFFDIRLWKNLRLVLRDMYVSILVSNPKYKVELGRLYADIYPQVAELYILADREPECSIISSLSTQLYTTPSIATNLVKYDYVARILAGIYTFITTQHIGPPAAVNPEASLPEDMRLLRNRRFSQLFHDLDYILNRNNEKHHVYGNPDRIAQVTDLMILFQGQSPMRRHKDQHVEYENESWIALFNTMPFLQHMGTNVALGISDSQAATRCLQVITPMLARWIFDCYGKHDSRSEIEGPPTFKTVTCDVPLMGNVSEFELTRGSVLDCRVDSALISLHHPVHAFISHIIENGKFESSQQLRNALIPDSDATGYCTHDQALLALLDHPLRVVVLLSQIQAGLWIRNGLSLRSQLIHYRDVTLRDVSFRRDLLMVQTMMVVVDPALAFIAIRDRWNIQVNPVDGTDDPNLDNSKRLYMIEEFLHFLIGTLMERTPLMGLDSKEISRRYTRREILQCLCFGEMTYSEISRTIPDHLASEAMFEDLLKEMTIYKPPQGVVGYGKYQIKPEYMEEFDTHYLHFSSTRVEEAEAVYIDHYRKLDGNKDKIVVSKPPVEKIESGAFVNLSAFTRTIPFAQMVRDLLGVVIDETNDSHRENILMNILQLLHICALDDFNCETGGASFANIMARELFEYNGEPYSVLAMLCHIVNEDIFNDLSNGKILAILSLIREKDPSLDGYLSSHLVDAKAKAMPQVETEAERRKRIGKEKRQLAMANMLNMQQKFADNNDLELEDEEDDATEEGGFTYFDEECILCRMTNNETVFGAIGYVMRSNVWRDVPFDQKEWVFEAFGGDADLDHPFTLSDVDNSGSEAWQQYRAEQNKKYKIGPGFDNEHTENKPVFVTCGHGLHYSCYQDYVRNNRNRAHNLTRNYPEDSDKGEFICPLCHSLCNVFLPCMWKQNQRKLDDMLATNTSFEEYVKKVESLDTLLFMYSTDYGWLGDDDIIKQGVEHMTPKFKAALQLANPSYFGAISDESEPQAELVANALDTSLAQSLSQFFDVCNGFFYSPNEPLNGDFVVVLDTLANNISSLEIALRGVGFDNFMSGLVVGQLKGRTLESIQMFSELCKSTLAILAALGHKHSNSTWYFDSLQRFNSYTQQPLTSPLRLTDMNFENLVRNAMVTSPGAGVDLIHLIKTYYMATIVNIAIRITREVELDGKWVSDPIALEMPTVEGCSDEALSALGALLYETMHHTSTVFDARPAIWTNPAFAKVVYSMLIKTVNPFLRKCAIFMHVLCGVGYKASEWEDMDDIREVDRLCMFLKLPRVNDLLVEMTSDTAENKLVNKWISDASLHTPKIEYPGIVRLLKLPNRLDEFFDLKNLSIDSDIEQVPADPAVCLFCGVSVGLQTINYDGDPRGECHHHMRKCGNDVGLYLLPKRSSLLLLRNNQGSFCEGPYLDLHGEVDETLRRGRPQFLHENRYDHFTRSVWLMHDIPSYIARKLETSTDFGGWETL